MEAYSPFDKATKAQNLKKIDTEDIIAYYLSVYNLDVRYIFNGNKFIYLCKCPITDLKYFYPFNLDGDDAFYQALSKQEWYYQGERWEFQRAIDLVKNNDKVLEIGSGRGNFIKKLIASRKVDFCGLELNKNAIRMAKEDAISLTDMHLNEHKKNCKVKYDVICSFQVFEHVSDIDTLFRDSIDLLTDNGLLIISVPNNDVQFIKQNHLDSRYLNMPPHHVNLFDKDSFKAIGKFYDLKLMELVKEPIQDLHVDTYLWNKVSKFFLNSSVLTRAFWKLKMHYVLRPFVKLFRENIDGHTIMCVYQKVNIR